MDGLRDENLVNGPIGQEIDLRWQRSTWHMPGWRAAVLALVRGCVRITGASRPEPRGQVRATRPPRRSRHRLFSFVSRSSEQRNQGRSCLVSTGPYHSDRVFRTWR